MGELTRLLHSFNIAVLICESLGLKSSQLRLDAIITILTSSAEALLRLAPL